MLAGAAVTEHHSLVQAAARIPEGVVCLLSALRFYGLTTIVPMDVWLAVPPGAKSSRPEWPPIRTIRMSGYAMGEGVVKHKLEGIAVRVFELAKTVADCFRFRNKIGLDIALETLREYRRSRSWDPDELWRFARTDGVDRILLPYLEAVA
jgi:predicted transcriptional regulator of viral defense system